MTATATFEDLRAEDIQRYEKTLRDGCLRDIMKWRTSEWRDMAVMCEEALEARVEAGKPIQPHVWAQARVYRDMANKSRHIRYGEVPTDTERAPFGNGSGNGTGGGRDKGMATDKQMTFLAGLLAGRTDDVATAAQARIDSVKGYVNRETASKLIDQLMQPCEGVVAYKERMTQGQGAFIASLLEKKNGLRADFARDMAYAMIPATTRNEASAIIDQLKSRKRAATAKVDEGFYVLDDVVYKVQLGVTTNNLFAKRLVIDRETEKGFEWVYEPGMIRKLANAPRLTVEQATALAVDTSLYGYCFMCGRRLTDEESIERMIGRICYGKLM